MVYIFPGGSVIYNGDTLSDSDKSRAAVVVDNLFPPDEIKGKQAILKWDVETQTAWYEYEDILPTEEENLQQEIETLRNDLDNAIIELTMAMFMQGGME